MTPESTILNLLKEHELRITNSRMDTLRVFVSNHFALSQPELEKNLGDEYDRVTIYRTLTSFLEKGLIHKVLDDAGAAKYALCKHAHNDHEHSDEHIHFKCVQCGNTHCIESLQLPDFNAPGGYKFLDTQILIHGLCPECNAKAMANAA